MTTVKLNELLQKYKHALWTITEEAAKTENYNPASATEDAFITSAQHLLWMVGEVYEFIKTNQMMKAMRWLGFIQHGMISMGLFTLPKLIEHSRATEEVFTTPPAGMATIPVRIHTLIASVYAQLTILTRDAWLPVGVSPHAIKLPNIDPNNRLPILEDIGIDLSWGVRHIEWDYSTNMLNLYMYPTIVSVSLSEESIALAVGMLREAGWEYIDDEARCWPTRLAVQKDMLANRKCPKHPNGCPTGGSTVTENESHGEIALEEDYPDTEG